MGGEIDWIGKGRAMQKDEIAFRETAAHVGFQLMLESPFLHTNKIGKSRKRFFRGGSPNLQQA